MNPLETGCLILGLLLAVGGGIYGFMELYGWLAQKRKQRRLAEQRMQQSAEPGGAFRLLNFSHPLTDEHLAQVEDLTGQEVERVIDVPTQIDADRHLGVQIVELADRAGLTLKEWQTMPLIVNLPGYAPAAAALLAELHGRIGHFPTVLWMQPVANSMPRRFRIADVIDLQTIRDRARQERKEEI